MRTRYEKDPEGIYPEIRVDSELDEHEGHERESLETLVDNPIEHTEWGYCHTCRKEFKIEGVTIVGELTL